jgi:hypothetical protein
MREFFKTELKNLHLTTGLQQYFKLSQMPDFQVQFKMLLDLLERECAKFPAIPDKDKEKIVQTCMIEDPEFQGFNPKILWKWFNLANRKYVVTQAQFDEKAVEWKEPTEEERIKINEMLEQWKMDLAKIGSPEPRKDGIKDQRIQAMKDDFAKIECKHPFMFNGLCLDCGEVLTDEERANAKDVTPKQKVLSQGTSQFSEDMLTPVTPSTGAESPKIGQKEG